MDTQPLLTQIFQHDELWNSDDAWKRKKPAGGAYEQADVVVLRYLTLGFTPGKLYLYEEERDRENWTRPAWHVLTEAKRLVLDVMRAAGAEHLGHVIITRLRPGDVISEHVDRWDTRICAPYWQRHQVPLQAAPEARFTCGGETIHMAPGTAYWFDNQLPHAVVNASPDQDRISMFLDLRVLA